MFIHGIDVRINYFMSCIGKKKKNVVIEINSFFVNDFLLSLIRLEERKQLKFD